MGAPVRPSAELGLGQQRGGPVARAKRTDRAGAVFLLAQPLGSNGLANLAFQLFVLPPTIAGSFLAGILAPRATYIAGGIAALLGALVFAVAVVATPTNLSTVPVGGASATPA